MSPAPATDVHRQLVQARDEHLSQVVALVDAMPCRGAADKLIEPLRPRLAVLAPARPLSLARLMFQPLDAVIMAGRHWQPGMAAVPRAALAPIAGAVLQRMGGDTAAAGALLAGRACHDNDAIGRAGAMLWPGAARVVAGLPLPLGWSGLTGLPDSCFEDIRNGVAAVLTQALQIRRCRRLPEGAELQASLGDIFTHAALGWAGAQGIMLAVLLGDARLAGPALAAAGKLSGAAVEAATKQALDRADHVLDSVIPSVSLAGAGAQAMQLGTLLDGLEGPGARPTVRGRVQRVRQSADVACQGRLLKALDADFLPKVAAAGAATTDADVTALEDVARGLRRLALAGRRFGAAATYDRLLGGTAAGLFRSPAAGLLPMDRLRLAELLLGPAAALQLEASGGLTPAGGDRSSGTRPIPLGAEPG